GQVPQIGATSTPPPLAISQDEALLPYTAFLPYGGRDVSPAVPPDDGATDPEGATNVASSVQPVDSDDEAVVAGTLRSPWKWEELIVESAIVGGRSRADGKARWRRRLDGLAADYRFRIAELERDEPESARIARFKRELKNL